MDIVCIVTEIRSSVIVNCCFVIGISRIHVLATRSALLSRIFGFNPFLQITERGHNHLIQHLSNS
jgi:hypothetical protein